MIPPATMAPNNHGQSLRLKVTSVGPELEKVVHADDARAPHRSRLHSRAIRRGSPDRQRQEAPWLPASKRRTAVQKSRPAQSHPGSPGKRIRVWRMCANWRNAAAPEQRGPKEGCGRAFWVPRGARIARAERSWAGFASANRSFTVDTRKVQAALNQSRLASLEADQSELRRLRERLASPELGRSERFQLTATAQRLEVSIGATRGKLEDAAPVVSTPNPGPTPWPASPALAWIRSKPASSLLVALLVEMGVGPFVTMSLAKVQRPMKVPTTPEPALQPDRTASTPARAGNQALPRPLEPGQTSLAAGLRRRDRPLAPPGCQARGSAELVRRVKTEAPQPSTAARRSSSLQPMSTAALRGGYRTGVDRDAAGIAAPRCARSRRHAPRRQTVTSTCDRLAARHQRAIGASPATA